MFEKSWINIIKHLNINWICLSGEKIFDFYNIKMNAIYFPQYHNSSENNKFWGKVFTEKTLLKPYPDEIMISGKPIQILKPHDDIGYYSLDSIDVFKKQIQIALTYGLNGFVIYHYWFGNSHSVLDKVEQHILTGQIDFPFCFSWANEPWTKRWDGLPNDMLIEQLYEDESDFTHINYLIKFFQMKNYIKNSQGACLLYIYNYSHIRKHIEKILFKWRKQLDKSNLQIEIISTENAMQSNKKYGTKIRFDFLPMSQTNTWVSHTNSELIIANEKKNISQHYEIDYEFLIEKFNSSKIYDDYHFGIPLNWNNIVRRNGLSHLHTNNISDVNLKIMILRTISKIILKYINCVCFKPIDKYNIIKYYYGEINYNLDNNVMIINAWNEWNEQAVLEPNKFNGYMNLLVFKNIFNI